MTRSHDTAVLGRAIRLARAARGWNQKQLADAAGVNPSQLCLIEGGRRLPWRSTLARLLAALGLSPSQFERYLTVARSAPPAVDSGLFWESREEAADLAAEVAGAVSNAVLLAMAGMPFGHPQPKTSTLPTPADRAPAPGRWARLVAQGPYMRRLLVQGAEEYRSWALCEHGCEESARAAADDPARALELAELARLIAENALGGEAWRKRLQGYARAFVGNARRVGGDLRGAERAFARARVLWEAGAAADPGLLDGSRLPDLEASLRRDQRRFATAVELLEQALVCAGPARAAHLLLNKAFTYEQMGDCEGAIAALEQAAPLVDGTREPHQLCVLRFNLAVNLCHLARYAEAAPLAAEACELAAELHNDLDLLRGRWLAARVEAGLGRRPGAITALSRVRDDFAARGHAYDAALATLNLAVLLLEEGRTAEVQALAREMAPIFESLGIDREALAAIRLFSQAGQQAAATAELGRRVLRFLERARYDRELRFDSGSP